MHIVGKKIASAEAGKTAAPIDIPASHRTSLLARVDQDRRLVGSCAALGQTIGKLAFVAVPAKVQTAGFTCWVQVNLLLLILTDIPDPKIATLAVKTETPGIAQPPVPDFWLGILLPDKWVVGRQMVGARRPYLDSQNFAQPGRQILASPQRVAAAAPIPQPNIQSAVGPKDNQPTVVIGVGLVAQQDAFFAARVGQIGVSGHTKTCHHRVKPIVDALVASFGLHQIFVAMVVVDQKIACVGVLWRKGDAQQPSFAVAADPIGDVEKRLFAYAASLNNFDPPSLLDHKESPRPIPRMGEVNRLVETCSDLL